MQTRSFGQNAERISALGLGCSRIGSFGNPTPIAEIRKTLNTALDAGVTLLDTADVYGQGESEIEIGRLVAGRRERAFIVTKAGKLFSRRMRMLRPLKSVLKPLLAASAAGRERMVARRQGTMSVDFSPRHLRAALEASLGRMKVDHVDGFLLHSPEPGVVADPAVGAALAELKQDGKLRHFGVSCDDIETLRAALDMPGVSLVEVPLTVLDEAAASGLAPRIAALRVGVLAREVIRLGGGVRAAEAVATAAGRPDVTSVVVGVSKLRHLGELIDAVQRSAPIAESA